VPDAVLPDRPRLAGKARLRWDRHGERYLLLYPEKGLALSRTAAEIVRLCTGEHTVDGIVSKLMETYAAGSRSDVEAEVRAFLRALAERGLVTHCGV